MRTPFRTSLTRRTLLAALAAALGGAAMPHAGAAEEIRFEHAFGEAVLPGPATRVVSLGFTTHDTLLALGIQPVAVRYWFGDQPFGVWPWAREKLGAAEPVVISGEVAIETVASLQPDLIVGIGSGVSQAAETRQRSQIVNLLDIQGEDQVTLKVTVAEVQRSIIKQLGIDGIGAGSIDGIAFNAIGDNPFGLGKAITTSGGSLLNSGGRNGITAQLSALEQAGVMRTLAEPSLTAISGESASFLVGGEFAIASGKRETPETRTPILGQNGAIIGYDVSPPSVEYQSRQVDYGIGLDFTPVVLGPGRISLKVRTAVSEPTFESPFTIPGGVAPGLNVPGIRKRLADTTVELPSGGSLVIAGLVRDEVRQVVSGFPGLSRLPILGTLFRSRDFQRYETELVVIVTPYLVRPVARQELTRPDDGLAFTSDGSANFLGRINRVYGATETNLPPGRYNGHVGYIYK